MVSSLEAIEILLGFCNKYRVRERPNPTIPTYRSYRNKLATPVTVRVFEGPVPRQFKESDTSKANVQLYVQDAPFSLAFPV